MMGGCVGEGGYGDIPGDQILFRSPVISCVPVASPGTDCSGNDMRP